MTIARFDQPWWTASGTSPQLLIGQTVHVYQDDGGAQSANLQTLYTDESGATTAPNPFAVDSQGNVAFFADARFAWVKVGSTTPYRVQVQPPTDWTDVGDFVVGDGLADDAAGLLAAAANAGTDGGLSFPPSKTVRVTSAITFDVAGIASAPGATILYDGPTTGVAVTIRKGTGATQRIGGHYVLPAIKNNTKPNLGWNADTGLRLINLSSARVDIDTVEGFETGLLGAGESSGFVYNEINVGRLENNKVNCKLKALDTNGWVNENTFNLGRYSHHTNEGTDVPGTRHILVEHIPGGVSQPNGNRWTHPSIETPAVAEYQFEFKGALESVIDQPRLERTGGTPRVWFNEESASKSSQQNVILWPTQGSTLAVTQSANSNRNQIWDASSVVMQGQNGSAVWKLSNRQGSTVPILAGYAAGLNTHDAANTSAWHWALTALGLRGKRSFDPASALRIHIALNDGNIEWADGTNPVDVLLGRVAAKTLGLRAGEAFRFGTTTTAARPSAATVGAGATLFDTDLGKLIVSDGTSWRDAVGTLA